MIHVMSPIDAACGGDHWGELTADGETDCAVEIHRAGMAVVGPVAAVLLGVAAQFTEREREHAPILTLLARSCWKANTASVKSLVNWSCLPCLLWVS